MRRNRPVFLMVRLEILISEEELNAIPSSVKPSTMVFAGSSPMTVIPDFALKLGPP